MQNLVKIGRSAAELLRIFDFQNGSRPPSWIWYDVIQLVFDGPNILLKLHVDRIYKRYRDFYAPPLGGGIIRNDAVWYLTFVRRLSRTSGLSREQRGIGRLKLSQSRPSPRHTRFGHHFQGQRSRSPGRFTHRGGSASASASCSGCRVDRGKVLTVRTEDADSVLVCCALQGRNMMWRLTTGRIACYIRHVWLEIAYSRPILGDITPNVFRYCRNPQKDSPLAKTRCMSHKLWIYIHGFDLGVCPRKNTVV